MKKNTIDSGGEWLPAGITAMNEQHKTLLRMADDLFAGCHYDGGIAEGYFRDVLRKMLEFIRRHFMAEEIIMEKIHYPYLTEHRRQHREILKTMVDQISKLESSPQCAPGKFPRRLLGLLITHIAVDDRKYAAHYRNSPNLRRSSHCAESAA